MILDKGRTAHRQLDHTAVSNLHRSSARVQREGLRNRRQGRTHVLLTHIDDITLDPYAVLPENLQSFLMLKLDPDVFQNTNGILMN
ncbi:hypothetical protein SDC9_178595 [bioreactor metagenome]|uniref:Uncharacterized protein n=1 Tax=bioreactor metagenome TaxID=1076179 RepID=A0A645GW63_9ZZZZ